MPPEPRPAGKLSQLRRGRVSQAWDCYVVTKVTHHRREVLAEEAAGSLVLESLRHLRETEQIKLFAFCVMPDHLHVALCLLPGAQLSTTVASFSKFTGAGINCLLRQSGRFWQEGFHDRHCRNRDELADLCEYIEHNPVRAGLVTVAADWAFSSASPLRQGMLDRDWWP
jgi:putative transposase